VGYKIFSKVLIQVVNKCLGLDVAIFCFLDWKIAQKNPLKPQFFVGFFNFLKKLCLGVKFCHKKRQWHGWENNLHMYVMWYVVINMGRGRNGGMGVDRKK